MIVGLLVINVNDGPRLTMTCFRTRTNVFACVFDLGKLLQNHLKGKTLKEITLLTED